MRKLRESGRIDGVDRGSQPCKISALNSSDGMPLLESPHTSTHTHFNAMPPVNEKLSTLAAENLFFFQFFSVNVFIAVVSPLT